MRNPLRTSKLRLSLLAAVLFVQCGRIENASSAQGWADLPAILSRIVSPQFPDRDFSISDFGARGDGTTDCTEAFRKAIAVCNAAGGGKVVVPEGVFLTGAIHLKSNVNLHITERAVVKFTTDPKAYAELVYTRWEGVECMNYSPLIYAYEQENIAITGSGLLDGQASEKDWWSWKGNTDDGWSKGMPNQKKARTALFEMAEKNIPVGDRVFGEGHYLRPNFVQPYKCRNVLIEGVTLKDSPMWFIHPVLCTNVTVKDVTVNGLGPNNDGCNPESSKDLLIKDCSFNTGDDCIAIKSGRNADGRRVNVPSENIVIQGCSMKDGHGGVVLGSEISGGVRNVFAEDCVMDSPNLDRALRFKTNSVRGGIIENFFARNICVGEVGEAVLKIDFFYEEGDSGEFTPVVRNLSITDLTCEKGKFAVWVRGYPRSPIANLRLERCQFDGIAEPNVIEAVEGLSLVDVTLNGKPMQ
jgi:polygalacturonase